MAAREADVVLADGATVHLRPIRPADAAAIVALHARFSERTRYLRFFSPYPTIPPRDLERFVTVDHHDREALVAQLGDRLIAVGRYERLGPASDEAEVAFVVEDAHQGRGVGSALLEHLAATAAEVGIGRFVAEVLPENGAMLRVFADAGYQVRRAYADGVVHLDFAISPTPRWREVRDAREQRAEARSVARLLAPRGVAVYGASRTGRGVGAALLRHLRSGGFAGPVVAVPPEGSIVDAGVPVDLAVVAVPAAAVPAVVVDAAAGGVHGLVVVSDGFADAGPAGLAAQQALVRLVREHGLRLVGPNCLGLANPAIGLNATLVPRLPAAGRVGLFSQSGAFGVALLAEAERRGIGLSGFVAVGNKADVSGNDLLQYWQDDPGTDLVLLHLEAFGNPRKFARLARRLGRVKPVAAVAGTGRPSGALDEPAVAALFARSGVIRVDTVPELFDVAVLLSRQPLPAGQRVAVITNSAALGALAAASCVHNGLQVAEGYPRDLGSRAGAAEVDLAVAQALGSPAVDALVVVGSPPLPDEASVPDIAGALNAAAGDAAAGDAAARDAAAGPAKPIVAALLAGPAPVRIPGYPWVEDAVRALGRVAGYASWRRTPTGAVPDIARHGAAPGASGTVPSRRMLADFGIDLVPSSTVDSEDAAVAAAAGYGYPVAVKAAPAAVRHRDDLGAVRLELDDEPAVRAAYRELAARFGAPALVQPMVAPGVACVVEVVEDPAFGPVVGFGLGGIAGELLGDRAWRAAPLTDRDAASLVREPRTAPLLFGYRGAATVDVAALEDLVLRVGILADAQPALRRLSLNPVLVRPDGLSVLHAAIEMGEPAERPDTGPRRI